MHTAHTIAAIATPPGTGGMAVLRMSGPRAIEIAQQVFRPIKGRPVAQMPGYTAAYGHLMEGDKPLDDGILTVFRAPHSYTGEDVCEFSCHGGDYLSRRALAVLVAAGARPALPGEFTKRAFLMGKMDLTRAESVIELIEAEGEQALRLARSGREGRTERLVDGIARRLIDMAAALAAYADYPDEDLGETDPDDLSARIKQELNALKTLIAGYEAGQIVRRGVSTALVGRPNVGKSSLMNRLFGQRRSIVSDIPGTTRDVVEAEAFIGGLRFILADTAGLREGDDPIEQEGVALSYARMERADLILCIIDASEPLSEEDARLLELLRGRRVIVVLNKSDRPVCLTEQTLPHPPGPVVAVSAKTGEGLPALEEAMVDACALPGSADSMLLASQRQLSCVLRATEALQEAGEALSAGVTLDAVAVLLEGAIEPLLELTGRRVSEAVIDALFEKFCVGK
jgi:tRNA modification GTPase